MAEAPTWEQIMRMAVERRLLDLHTAQPAHVDAYDGAIKARVQPVLMEQHQDEDGSSWQEQPELVDNVPVWHLSGGGFSLTLPLRPGDPGLLLACERAIGPWKARASGGVIDPQVGRMFDVTDGVFLPGVRPLADPPPQASDTDLVLAKDDGSCEVRLAADSTVTVSSGGATVTVRDGSIDIHAGVGGKVRVRNSSADLVALVDQLAGALQTALVTTLLGPMPLDPATQATLAQIRALLATLKV